MTLIQAKKGAFDIVGSAVDSVDVVREVISEQGTVDDKKDVSLTMVIHDFKGELKTAVGKIRPGLLVEVDSIRVDS